MHCHGILSSLRLEHLVTKGMISMLTLKEVGVKRSGFLLSKKWEPHLSRGPVPEGGLGTLGGESRGPNL